MSEQDELRIVETNPYWDAPNSSAEGIYEAGKEAQIEADREILAKVKQHYEQKIQVKYECNMNCEFAYADESGKIDCACMNIDEAPDWCKIKPEQKRLDRPDREKLAVITCENCVYRGDGYCREGFLLGTCRWYYENADQILALIEPLIEEAKKQRDIQWVKFLMYEKHYMSDIPPTDYGGRK